MLNNFPSLIIRGFYLKMEINKSQAEKLIMLLDDDCWSINGNFSLTELERNEMIKYNNTLIEMLKIKMEFEE